MSVQTSWLKLSTTKYRERKVTSVTTDVLSVMSVIRNFLSLVTCIVIKEFTLENAHTNVMSVTKVLHSLVTYVHMRELTLERNLLDVMSATRDLYHQVA